MKTEQAQRGQAIILIVLAIIGMVGLVALAVDGGNAFADRRHAQSAADSAALAAALSRANNGTSTEIDNAALGIALNNGYGYQITEVNNPPSANDCNPGDTPSIYVGNDEYIQVIIRSDVDTYFARIMGVEQLHNCVEAIAHGQPSTYEPLFDGSGLVALAPTGTQTCMFNSNANLNITDGAMFCNSNNSQAFWLDSNAHLFSDGGYGIVGSGYKKQGNAQISGGAVVPNQTQYPYPPDLSAIPTWQTAAPQPACGGAPQSPTTSGGITTYYPGTYGGNLTLNSNANVRFSSGVYCLNGGININSNVNATGGNVTWVIGNTDINFNSNTWFDFDGFIIYSQNGSLNMNSNGSTNADVFRFYSSGSGAVKVSSNYSLTSGDAFIYMPTGEPILNSNGVVTLTAPRTGPYAGLIYYLPVQANPDTHVAVNINSNANLNLTGTFLAPAANLTINSNGTSNTMSAQIIVYKFTVNSNGNLNLNYNPATLYGGVVPPTIELVR